ncbi:protein of unknown function [Cupriavidus taiwanensis]|uniref:Uncharacterized protein n=1 Tax=Cupriavidus taiwanensis TaxID=164546 RepID=A0A375IEQ1_9BURK|nr:hypothetical protein CBM2592_A100049 [Cupriavidus taiwanensis]SOY58729.1 hypothetical protein CBM2588_A70048 [Cupriavidus taiwanensis]SOZ50606.1 hypothetical protein CBM2617_A100049 [Cupriavidus taiwanensis]SOZ76735.1 hypothetical protein CBM2618_A110049 [Cupriavidus taiwanensis]SOZ81386.1 hypothetical protein CBM2621_A110048 [Cupriavidus taiwanensis]
MRAGPPHEATVPVRAAGWPLSGTCAPLPAWCPKKKPPGRLAAQARGLAERAAGASPPRSDFDLGA